MRFFGLSTVAEAVSMQERIEFCLHRRHGANNPEGCRNLIKTFDEAARYMINKHGQVRFSMDGLVVDRSITPEEVCKYEYGDPKYGCVYVKKNPYTYGAAEEILIPASTATPVRRQPQTPQQGPTRQHSTHTSPFET
jgi:hypothetical protein